LIEKDPQNETFYLELINNCLKAGDYERALINIEKGLFNIPNSISLIDKKADILGTLHRYEEALTFLQSKMAEGNSRGHLERRYNLFLEEAARFHRRSDPYTLYRILYDKNPRNEEAFKYIVSTAISNGYYDDAIEVINKAKTIQGETKELLVKEQHVYNLMGLMSKADQLTVKLYELYPDDYDIKYQYTQYRMRLGKACMADELYEDALNHWSFVAQNGEEDVQKAALASIYNCSFQLKKYNEALLILEQLIYDHPRNMEWRVKKAAIFGEQNKYGEALEELEFVVNNTPLQDREKALSGYDEMATVYTKRLIENYLLVDALRLIDHWLEVVPKSKMAIRYAINICVQMENHEAVKMYASMETEKDETGDIYPQIKLAEAHNHQKEHKESLDILAGEIAKNPYHRELIGAYSQSNQDYAKELIKNQKYDESIMVLDSALRYDRNNKELKYWKGVAYEKIHRYDSAYYFQSFYDPSLMEFKNFDKHLKYLKNRTYKNQVGINYLHSRFSDIDVISSIATIEYSRFEANNTFTGRINYAGRQGGKGLQGQLEWSHIFRYDLYTRIDAAYANKFFASYIFNASVFKTFKYEWEAELGAGYRKLADDNNMFNVVVGIAKELEPVWLNLRFNSLMIEEQYYYSLLAQSRFYFGHPKSYITIMGSLGSAPDIDVIDYQLYDGLSVTNSMVGLGAYHMLNDKVSVGVLGNWYNYEDNSYNFTEGKGKYRNLYNVYFQLHINF